MVVVKEELVGMRWKWWRREREFGGRREAVMTVERRNGFF